MKALINTFLGGSGLLAAGYAITADHYTGLVTAGALWFGLAIVLLVYINTDWIEEKGNILD